MNKKKACIESLAAQEPSAKVPKRDGDAAFESGSSNSGPALIPSSHSLSLASTTTNSGGEIISTTRYGNKDSNSSYNTSSSHPDPPVSLSETCLPSRTAGSELPGGGVGLPETNSSNSSRVLNNNLSNDNANKSGTFLNQNIINHCMKDKLQQAFVTSSNHLDEKTGASLGCIPFKHCILPNFIQDFDFVKDLETVLKNIDLQDKSNDLYKFHQSSDLNHSKSVPVTQFRSLLDTVKDFLTSVTGIILNSKIDLFCSHYKYTDVLLCHDDELEERRVAFIYYLVPENWNNDDGGTLDLFDMDEHGQPRNVVRRILPKRNNFLFFEVSAKSFHQVAEILSENKVRMSLSGWFHGPPLARPTQSKEAQSPAVPFGSIEENVFYSWFNPLYLSREVQIDIRKRFENDSQIELTDFLQEEKYQELMDALNSRSIDWKLVGPANKRNYYTSDSGQLPPVVSEYLRVIHSDAAFLVLSNLTGLHLHPFAQLEDDQSAVNGNSELTSNGGVMNPRCRSQVRRWEHGCYTLAHDGDNEMTDFALDTMLYVGCEKEWSFDNGGYTSYIVKGEDEELLSVTPAANSLALVYRDKDTIGFTKHLNHRVSKLRQPNFYEVNCIYYE